MKNKNENVEKKETGGEQKQSYACTYSVNVINNVLGVLNKWKESHKDITPEINLIMASLSVKPLPVTFENVEPEKK